jgi:hypothetical protein
MLAGFMRKTVFRRTPYLSESFFLANPGDNQIDYDTTTQERRCAMAIYTCEKCGMSIGTMTCGKCGAELVDDSITLDSGKKVQIAKCPNGHGKVKSPQCCGEDMTCSI